MRVPGQGLGGGAGRRASRDRLAGHAQATFASEIRRCDKIQSEVLLTGRVDIGVGRAGRFRDAADRKSVV